MLKFNINGDKWTMQLVSDEQLVKLFGEGVEAVTVYPGCRIYVSESGCTKETIIHELCHAYFNYTCVSAAQLDFSQFEEVWCEFFAVNGKHLLEQAEKLFKQLKKEL